MTNHYRLTNRGRRKGRFFKHLKFYEIFFRQVKENCFGQAQTRRVERVLSGVPKSLARHIRYVEL